MNKILSRINAQKALLGAAIMGTAVTVSAALPDGVKTSIEASKADGMEAGWLVVGVVVAIFVISIVKRIIK